ncbi:MAG: (d)CMP kinase [Myxococcales bacterium]|nr:(d)CMP kinase [Myxococcales bacterium]
MIVAIDGPAGAGKTTVSLRVAAALGAQLVSTGALYRAVALLATERGVALDDVPALVAIAAALNVDFAVVEDVNRVWLDGQDRTEALRTPDMSRGASIVSAIPEVRAALLQLQRDYAATRDVVMEGRDIGTVVFPNADIKVFLTASVRERARRRAAEYGDAGVDLDAVAAEIEERDRRDSERETAPLVAAPDAVVVDATELGVDEVVARIVGLAGVG